MEPVCRREGGPDDCPFVIVGCYCGHADPENPEPGYNGHDVCGGCGQWPEECECGRAAAMGGSRTPCACL